MTQPFLETPRFPDDLSFWARGGVGFSTTMSTQTSGREQRNILWQYGLGQWDLQNCYRKNSNVADPLSVQYLRNFFRVCKGRAYGFRFRDWTDYTDEGGGILGAQITSLTAAVVPSGSGLGVPTLQMFKAYIAPPLADYRLIQKPLAVQFYRNGVLVPAGTGTGQAQVDTTTGLVTFGSDSSAAITGWTPGATTAFTVAAVPSGWTSGKKLYFSGVVGDTGGVLNGQAVTIASVAGTTVTVNANTTGRTLSSGTAYMYPQTSDSLAWTGTFDTPCRFNTDVFAPQMDLGTGALYGFQALPIVEIRL